MASSKKHSSPSIDVDRRVAIALEALSGVERRRVETTLRDPSSFAPKRQAAKPSPIQSLNPDGSLLIRAVDPSLRIVFSREGDRVHVVDLVRQETLDRFGQSDAASPAASEITTRPVDRKRRPG